MGEQPSYRMQIAIDEMSEEDLDDLYGFIDGDSKSGEWDDNSEDQDRKRWWGVRFRRKSEAVYFKTRFNARVVEWDESGVEPRTIEELLKQGYVHGSFRVADEHSVAFQQWCDERDIGIVDEIKFGGDSWPYNIYAPNEAMLTLAIMTWAASLASR